MVPSHNHAQRDNSCTKCADGDSPCLQGLKPRDTAAWVLLSLQVHDTAGSSLTQMHNPDCLVPVLGSAFPAVASTDVGTACQWQPPAADGVVDVIDMASQFISAVQKDRRQLAVLITEHQQRIHVMEEDEGLRNKFVQLPESNVDLSKFSCSFPLSTVLGSCMLNLLTRDNALSEVSLSL